jgi:phage-related minor tail protein
VRKGKLDFRDLVTSMIADLARLAARRFILGPLAGLLSGVLGGAGGMFASVLHAGGTVGRPVPAAWSRRWPSPVRRGCIPAAGPG